MATYDPVSTATALAENYVYARQAQLDTAASKAQSQVSALTSLKSSLTTFTSAITTFTGKGDVVAQTATVSNASSATATASSVAAPGVFSFQVEQLATSQQTLYRLDSLGLKSANQNTAGDLEWPVQPKIVVSLGDGGFFSVDLSGADADGDGKLSVTEVARAINTSSQGKVSAAVITNGTEQQLMLNAGSSGEKGAFQLHALSGASTDADVKAFVDTLAQGTNPTSVETVAPVRHIVEAQNAKIWIGSKPQSGLAADGVLVEQSSNTYTGIEGLSVEFKTVSAEPVTVSVKKDEAATKANMDAFVSAYNTLMKSLDKLTASGNAESGVAAGALANDSSVRGLRSQLNNLLRSEVGGVRLTDFGISAQRDGTIALDAERFAKKVAANPEALTNLLGKSNALDYKRSGVLGSMQTYLESWTKSAGGLLQSRQDSLQKQQAQFTKQQATIDSSYSQAYQRYLTQFSALANLETQMGSTTSMLAAMFSSKSDSSS